MDSSVVDRIFEQSVSAIVRGKTEVKNEEGGFFQELMSALLTVKEAQQDAREKSIKMVLGEIQDIHDVMIAREKAEVLFQLFLEVRNRAVQAFENIMRAQF